MDISFIKAQDGPETQDAAGVEAVAVMASKDVLLGPRAEAVEARTGQRLSDLAALYGFSGADGEVLDVAVRMKGRDARLLVVGVGERPHKPLAFERWAAHAARRAAATGVEALVLDPETEADPAVMAVHAAMGADLASYRFDRYRTGAKAKAGASLRRVEVVSADPDAAGLLFERHRPVLDGVRLARDLVSEPANVLHPEAFADLALGLRPLGLEVTVLDVDAMARLGLGALLGVGRGSRRPPRLVTLSWRGGAPAARPLALIGKGITFDSGGLSLKLAANMEGMKGDMAGAAAVLGAMQAIATRKARANVVGILALADNMPDGDAIRPGDVLTAMSGQTIEVLNTDAEGRLVLADALCYAQAEFAPCALVDLATLTGAIATTFGHDYAGLFSNDDALSDALTRAGAAEGDRIWRLPLDPAYDRLCDSKVADVKNIPAPNVAGSIVGAQFLQRFVRAPMPWAHLDIYGVAMRPPPYDDPKLPTWATGFGVRLLDRLVADGYEEAG
jgi:leucyl aminopeptidase